MSEFMLCSVEDTFRVTGRGLIIAPMFPVSAFQFDANQQVRVIRPDGEKFECRAHFQIPFQSPPAKVLSFVCALVGVEKEQVPIGSQIWLLGLNEAEVRRSTPSKGVEELCAELNAAPEGTRAPLLIELLERGGHERHEDIVFELGLIGEPAAVDPILRAAKQPFAYLEEWGNLHEFQRKCAYALARIATIESRAALQQLTQAEDPHLREYGEEGLAHWPLPYRAS
jgi:hypothetical protein